MSKKLKEAVAAEEVKAEQLYNEEGEVSMDYVEATGEEVTETEVLTEGEVKQGKIKTLFNKGLGFIGRHKLAVGIIGGVAGTLAADAVIKKVTKHKSTYIIDSTEFGDSYAEPAEIDYEEQNDNFDDYVEGIEEGKVEEIEEDEPLTDEM